MRTAFAFGLTALDHAVVDLSVAVGDAVRDAAAAALTEDLVLAEHVLSRVHDLHDTADDISRRAAAVMARQQPVAHDLRRLLGVQRNADALGRMATLAADIAKVTRRRYPRRIVPAEVRGVVEDLSAAANTVTALIGQSLSRAHVSHPGVVERAVSHLDQLHREMLTIISSRAWPHDVETAVDMSLLSLDFHRLAEHALEVAGSVQYVATGDVLPQRRHRAV